MTTVPEENDHSLHTAEDNSSSSPQRKQSLRWWPAAIILALMLLIRLLPVVIDSAPLPVLMLGFMGPMIAALLIFPWWLFASRTSIREKLLGLVALIAIAILTMMLSHSSMQGMPNFMYQLPVGMAAFTLPLIFLAGLPSIRLPVALFVALLGFGVWDLVRFDGVTGEFSAAFSFRWTPSHEDEYLASLSKSDGENSSATIELDPNAVINATSAEWPIFRGRERENTISEIVLDEDWDQHPPKLIWKSLIGPGWSSFSVAGNRLFTQEQRGESEAVVCLDAKTGAIAWAYEYPGRFFESIGGAGPRATPTIGDKALFCLGADGDLLCLDPLTGKLIWQRDLRQDAERDPPIWGWSSSPLVVYSKVVVHAGGANDKGVIAYDALTGDLLWSVASGDHSYSSAQLAEFDGVSGVLMVSNAGLQFLDLEDGHTIWNYEQRSENYRVLQPLISENNVLLADSMGVGTRCLTITRSDDKWQVTESWTSRYMKPQYNDFVLYDGNVYGFDGSIFASISMETGEQNWKRGRYGNGQVLLLDSAGQLLLTSEKGEIVLIKPSSEELIELAKFPAIEGKTWNHPVLINNRLYLRNGQEAACYELTLKNDDDS